MNLKELIKIYKAEAETAKKSTEFFKTKINLTYQVSKQWQITYERVVEDLEKLVLTENES